MGEELCQNVLKAKLHQAKYNATHIALNNLCGADKGVSKWKEMKDTDVQCMQDPEPEEKHAKWRNGNRRRGKPCWSSAIQRMLMGPGWVKVCDGYGRVQVGKQMIVVGC